MSKVILITGSSRGIGAETAILAAKQGYDVCLNYKSDLEAAQHTLDQICALGRKAIAVRADVSNERDVMHLFRQCDEKLGKVDVLVNNVGIVQASMRVDEFDGQRLRDTFLNNISSYFLCAKQAILRMSTKYNGHGGAIINVSSVASRLGSPNEYVDYAASKGAVDSFTIGLAKEVAQEEVRVNCVRPGFIKTDIHHDKNRIDNLKANIPLQRGGEPREVAEGILWLASDSASYVTGTFIDIAGGC